MVGGSIFLGDSPCQIWSRSDGRVEKMGGGYRHTDYETFTSMSGTILPTMCQLLVCRYSTANNVSTFGGDPVTQLIVNVYQMIKL